MNASEQRIEFVHGGAGEGRLDVVLLSYLTAEPDYAHLTRSQLKQWIEEGRVLLDGVPAHKAGQQLKQGQGIVVDVPPPALPNVEPVQMPLDILHEDHDLLVVNKQAGISMHPGAGNTGPTLLNGVCWHLRGAVSSPRCGLVHRLDKDTTGVVLIAKTAQAESALTAQFAERSVTKEYLALVFTTPRAKRAVQVEESGTIRTQIGRHPGKRTLMAVLPEEGREAITNWRRLEELSYATLLAVAPKTGRTHQIRVHMQYLGSPIVGDPVYGGKLALPAELSQAAARFGRQALHARSLVFRHPSSGTQIRFEAALPPDFEALLRLFREYQP